MFGGIRKTILLMAMALAVVTARTAPSYAGDRVADLTQMLSSSSEKTRLSAVVSLARLGDKRALKPLVTALHDPSAQVRAIAAIGLGHLGHKAALPSLKNAAIDDTDETVRDKAREAAALVAKANGMPDELAASTQNAQAMQPRHGSGFGRAPHAVEDHPDLFVEVKSSSDDSPGSAPKAMRQAHADFLKQTLNDELKAAPQVTIAASEAQRWGLDARHIDLSVVKLDVAQNGATVEIEAELRLAISDDTGKMLSFLSGGAKVQVPRAKFKAQNLPELRKEALEGAMRGMFDKLITHLRQTSQS